jgi:alkanesulfonate monooxygenase SsuD/methylene tetrahydromethanopterin reductase-like flavin-dependent oxidoreductase (luciferase family)
MTGIRLVRSEFLLLAALTALVLPAAAAGDHGGGGGGGAPRPRTPQRRTCSQADGSSSASAAVRPSPPGAAPDAFGYSIDPDEAREKTALFRAAIAGAGVVPADIGGRPGDAMLAVQPQSPGLANRIWWGSGSRETAVCAGEQGLNLIDGAISRFGRGYTGEPDRIADELAKDAAVRAADTILLTVPSQRGSTTTSRCSRPSLATSRPPSAGT